MGLALREQELPLVNIRQRPRSLTQRIDSDPVMGAWISEALIYRYALWRVWDRDRPLLLVSMLNPSTADARHDDPTINKVCKYAVREGYGGVLVVNAYAYRATDPKDLMKAHIKGTDIVGPLNDMVIRQATELCPAVLVAHGARIMDESEDRIAALYRCAGLPMFCLGATKAGNPLHPLYQRDDQPFQEWVQPQRKVIDKKSVLC